MAKMRLAELKVQSFIVSMERKGEQRVKGGISIPHPICLIESEAPSACCPSEIRTCP